MSNFKHGHATKSGKSPTYISWRNMMVRCYSKKSIKYTSYGGSGITVCQRWHIFQNFLDDMGERPDGHTLDRYPTEVKVYSMKNCRWATPTQQCLNRKKSGKGKFIGVTARGARWRAGIKKDGKTTYLGTFDSEKEAAEAYDKEAKHLWATDARLNFQD